VTINSPLAEWGFCTREKRTRPRSGPDTRRQDLGLVTMTDSASESLPQRWRRIEAKIKKRRKRKKAPRPDFFPRQTAKEIRSHFQFCYGRQLPDDDAGRDDAELMLAYLAQGPHSTVKMESFLQEWCPWMQPREREQFVQEAATSPPPYFTADELAERLGVTYAERQERGYRVIGAIDADKAERARLYFERRGTKARQRSEKHRRAKGAKPRAQYLAEALSSIKPWEAEGISRRTWYRRRSGKMGVAQVRSPINFSTKGERTCAIDLAARPQGDGRRKKVTSTTVHHLASLQYPARPMHLCGRSSSLSSLRWPSISPMLLCHLVR
jgi:hypothetical protein